MLEKITEDPDFCFTLRGFTNKFTEKKIYFKNGKFFKKLLIKILIFENFTENKKFSNILLTE